MADAKHQVTVARMHDKRGMIHGFFAFFPLQMSPEADTKDDEEPDVQPEAEPGQDTDEGLQESNDTEWDINLSDEDLAVLIDGQEPEVEYDEES